MEKLNLNNDLVIGQTVKILPKSWYNKQELIGSKGWQAVKFPVSWGIEHQSISIHQYDEDLFKDLNKIFVIENIVPFKKYVENGEEQVVNIVYLIHTNKSTKKVTKISLLSCYLNNFKPIIVDYEVKDLIKQALQKYKFVYKYSVCTGGGSGVISELKEDLFKPILINESKLEFGILIPWIHTYKQLSLSNFKNYVLTIGKMETSFDATEHTHCNQYIKFGATKEEFPETFNWQSW